MFILVFYILLIFDFVLYIYIPIDVRLNYNAVFRRLPFISYYLLIRLLIN
jgi:hypothetical protein